MLDENDLQAIKTLIDESIKEAEDRITRNTVTMVDEKFNMVDEKFNMVDEKFNMMDEKFKRMIVEAESRITRNTVIMMDAEFKKSFNLLAEQIQIMQDMLVPPSRVDDLSDQVDVLKTVVRDHSARIDALEKAI